MAARQISVLLLANILLILLVQMTNHALSPWRFQLLLPGLLIAFPALNLKTTTALLVAGLTGLWFDSAQPVPFGLFTTFLLLSTVALLRLRLQWHHEQRRSAYGLCHLANLAIVTAAAIALGGPALTDPLYWLGLGIDLGLSHLVLLALIPWFFKLQQVLLELVGADLSRDPDSH